MRQAKANIKTGSERANAIEDVLQETARTTNALCDYAIDFLSSRNASEKRLQGTHCHTVVQNSITTRLAGIDHDKGYLILRFIHSGCPGLAIDKESSTQNLQSTVVIKATTSLR